MYELSKALHRISCTLTIRAHTVPRFLKARVLAKAAPFMRKFDEHMSHFNRKPAYRGPGRPTLGAATGKDGKTIDPGDKLAVSALEENMEKVLAFMLWSAGITLSPIDSGLSARNITESMSAFV